MAQISTVLYNTIADAYASIQDALSTVNTDARTALDAIVDVDTLDYPNPSNASADDALEIELALLQVFNSAYIGSQNIQNSTASLLDAVTAVNDFVITNTSGSDTATVKLDTWINTSMSSFWTNAQCPSGWEGISSDAGYDTAAWVTV